MRTNFSLRTTHSLLAAALVFGAAAAQAANGISITQSQESSVTVGMSTTEVERILGRPARTLTYRNATGPTWKYHVIDAPFGITDFDISFGADGKVLYASEQVIGGSGR